MANVQRYAKAAVYLDGAILSEAASVTVKRDSGGNDVKTLAKGYAGRSQGAPMTSISVKNAVPAEYIEKDVGTNINENEPVEVTIFAANKTLTCVGFISDDNFSSAVDSNGEIEFNFTGGPSAWE